MEILLTGSLKSISTSFVDKLTDLYKVVLASNDINKNIIGKECKSFSEQLSSQGFMKLFSTYSFETVIYFAGRPDENRGYFNDLQDLEITLKLCSDYDVKRVIFISSTYVYQGLISVKEETQPVPGDGAGVLLHSCEKLCEVYRKNNGLSIVTLRVPILFGLYENVSIIGNLIQQIATKNFAQISGSEHQLVDFLSQEDLSELVVRIIQDWPEKIITINVQGARQLTFSELSVSLRRVVHTTRISFSDKPAMVYQPVYSNIAKREFDWVPLINVEDDINLLIENINAKNISKISYFKQKIIDFFKSQSNILKTIELAIGYIIMELLNTVTSTTAQFQFVDFRLLFIVLLGSIHGLNTGFVAAFLASISLTIGYMNDGMDWRLIVYNIDNWLPYAAYFIAGAITGYTKDKHVNDYTYLNDEKNDLERRYKFLNDVYNSSLQNKKQFKRQIISYRDSFGRILDITKKLNTVLPDLIFKEALLSLEDILENQTISIYSIEKNSVFGRLRVCSKKIIESTAKSIDLNKYDLLIGKLRKNEVWRNIDCIPSYPDYVFPIYRDDNLALLVMINKVSHEQMAMYFENLLKIVCNLIEVSLLRAQQYNDRFTDEFYLPNTRILKKDAFRDVLRVRAQMEEVAISEYSLISVEATPETINEVGLQLQKYLRESDVVGEGDNGQIYIILSQATEEDIPFVLGRLKKAGLSFNQISDDLTNEGKV
ncbi:MAG: hypothetical protein A2Y17_03550 [Clostridiales bacterium GWF2_38_85]|nr:MAG: hypothetical protein A2Y17_03550 [Clostridiales bacterium GWF2_38_85]HBL85283.1 hypothetical protein [Clostridiales bacterium]